MNDGRREGNTPFAMAARWLNQSLSTIAVPRGTARAELSEGTSPNELAEETVPILRQLLA